MSVVDTTNPAITQPADGILECRATPVFSEWISSGPGNSSCVVHDSDTSTAGCGNTYSETRTWHAVDACGNTSGRVHQTIMVVDDQPPTIGGQGSAGTIESPVTPSFTSPTARDTCGTSSVVLDSDTS